MPNKNEVYALGDEIVRILQIKDDQCLVIDCSERYMPIWKPLEGFVSYSLMVETDLYTLKGFELVEEEKIAPERLRIMRERYTIIAPVLSFIGDETMRSHVIRVSAEENGVSKQTIRQYLKRYLVLQHIQALLPTERCKDNELSLDQKNMRWGLNKYFYTYEKHSLHTAYVKMLQAKYCDEAGKLVERYPTYYQFRYFYRKTRRMENYYISRNGLTNYQRNNRPCLGDNVRVYASAPGLGMVDATVCDIYLVNESGQVVGRPLLVACIDAFSSLCMGYSLLWEGGVYSVRDLMLNIIADKPMHCLKYGIHIEQSAWPVNSLPGRIMSDQGSEYIGATFEQIVELGVTLENLPSYRPDLKGPIEKFFDTIQGLYKKSLKGKGVIEPDFQERGAHDYRRDACLTMESFEKIIIRCIVYYNSANVIEEYPFTEDMLKKDVKPYPCDIWRYGCSLDSANLIEVSRERLTLCLLPRASGSFTRYGLSVNRLRYKNAAFKDKYLTGGSCVVAYDPDSASYVWLIDSGEYVRFELIESRYKNKTLKQVEELIGTSKSLTKAEKRKSLQAEIDLAGFIQNIVETSAIMSDSDTKGIRETKRVERSRKRKHHAEESGLYD